ncbi:MAG TPA: bifunctional diaminohydroxyphosphoribosylaminopyrimidine deaminase/5-amino-6-(5-phosphoribosylamino)uracil reductase RibD [Terriglobales bacterium]|nr:bifunctional diaminohydroxyphosphoribosylaminopyrimidine deaminase/5-amino-6-(5-phosphoribosylamino)uracil reductase RibD [Terriglobales bacterium]
MTAADRDLGFMEMAYGLAERARGCASPNPLVGSVIVRDGAIAGVGFHEQAGRPHAEVNALRMAGERARGGTIYVTLEPCVHWGRTPPCVDALLAAGLKRAVISAHDPNPLVHRKGAARLRAAGLDVEVGLLAEKNARLNEAYIKYITRKVPFVTLKAAASFDGKTATRAGDSKWISAPATRDYVHLLRGESDALMVGIGTLLADDPRLTVRHPTWGRKKVLRVVLDSMLRFPLTARLLGTLDRGRVIVFGREGAPAGKAEALRGRGVEVVLIDRPLDEAGGLERVLAELGRREIVSLLVEGGGRLVTSFVERRLADKIILTLSPKLIGGREARGVLEGRGAALVREALELRETRAFRLGNDLILEGYF